MYINRNKGIMNNYNVYVGEDHISELAGALTEGIIE